MENKSVWMFNLTFSKGNQLKEKYSWSYQKKPAQIKFGDWKQLSIDSVIPPRTWYFSVKVGSINTGRVKSRYDDAIFFWHNSQLLQSILSSHLDDYFWSETERFHKNVTDHNIRKKFAIKKEETQAFKYLGLNIAQEKTNLYSSEKVYSRKRLYKSWYSQSGRT